MIQWLDNPRAVGVDDEGVVACWHLPDGGKLTLVISEMDLMLRHKVGTGEVFNYRSMSDIQAALLDLVAEPPRVAPARTQGLWTTVSEMVRRTLR